MRVLVDTNIVLDVLCDREPFNASAKALWSKAESGAVQASIAATTLTDIFYIVCKQRGHEVARQAITNLLLTFAICPIDGNVLRMALSRPMPDYEDAVLDAAAELAGIPVIVTRNAKDFAGSSRRIVDADTLVKELDASSRS